MSPDDEEWFDFPGFIREIEEDVCRRLLAEGSRFQSAEKLVRRFRESSTRLLEEGPRKRFRDFQENHNELCVAFCILRNSENRCSMLEYEPHFLTCPKRIDFKATSSKGLVTLFDVKTISPISQDDWSKYEDTIAKKLFPPGVEVDLEEEWLGGELWHDMTAARSKMLEYAIELEEKVASCFADISSAPLVLAFCGDPYKWHVDALEDFVDFYRTGRYRYDDPFSKMEAHYISKRSIRLTRQISRFAYFGRPSFEILPRNVHWDVRGPRFGQPT